MQGLVEYMDNRGQQHNLQIRGVLELSETDQIRSALPSILNNILNRRQKSLIGLKGHTGHWALEEGTLAHQECVLFY